MTIIVTGGAGFIGGNFVYYELEKHPEDRVVCLDSLTYAGNLATLEEAMKNPNFRFVKGDITDREAVETLFAEEKPDIVVNFAAETHVDRSVNDPGLFLRTNILGTQTLMDACRKYSVGRFIRFPPTRCTATCPGPAGPVLLRGYPHPYLQPLQRFEGLGGSAGAGLCPHLRLPVSITRCSNNYGPTSSPKSSFP